MTDRIDHAVEALRVVSLPVTTEESTTANATAYAQVHATLALAEQQRIANLIALANSTHQILHEQTAQDAAEALVEFRPHSAGGYFQPATHIAQALGIKEQTND